MAVGVDAVYDNLADASGVSLLLATIFFAFQIYCDFSAYSDIRHWNGQNVSYQFDEKLCLSLFFAKRD